LNKIWIFSDYSTDCLFVRNTICESDWNHFGGVQPLKSVMDAKFDALLKVPRNNTYLLTMLTNAAYRVIIRNSVQQIYHIGSWNDVGGVQNYTIVDRSGIKQNLNCSPVGDIKLITGGNASITVCGWAVDGYPFNVSEHIHVNIGGLSNASQTKRHDIEVSNTNRLNVNNV
jgi:hypothetical protein